MKNRVPSDIGLCRVQGLVEGRGLGCTVYGRNHQELLLKALLSSRDLDQKSEASER